MESRELWRRIDLRGVPKWLRRHSFVRNISVVSFASLLEGALGFLQGVVVARWLGPAVYGIATLVMSYPLLVFGFLEAQGNAATIKYLGEFQAQGKQRQALAACKLAYCVSVCLASLTWVIVAMTSSWVKTVFVGLPNDAALLMTLFSLSFIPRGLSGPSQAILTVFGEFKLMGVSHVLATIIRVALVVSLIFAGFGVHGLIFANAAGLALEGLVVAGVAQGCMRTAWRKKFWTVPVGELRHLRRDIFRFWIFTRLTQIANSVQKHFGAVILGYFQPPEQVGYLRIAHSISVMLSNLFSVSSRTVTYPHLVRLWSVSERTVFRDRVMDMVARGSVILGGIGLVVMLTVPGLIPLFAGASFNPAVNVCRIMLIGIAVGMAGFWVQPFFLATGQTRFWFGLSVVSSLVLVGGYSWGASAGGATGVALAHAAIIIGRHVAGAAKAFRFMESQRVP